MDLRTAIVEQWRERFSERDPGYMEGKLQEVKECSEYDDLIYHCMNIDMQGHGIIAKKLKMSHRDFAFLLSAHRAMSQGGIYEGENGFAYKEEETIEGDERTTTYTYPDGTEERWVSKVVKPRLLKT